MLRKAGDVAAILGTVIAALFIAVMSGLMMARSSNDAVDAAPPIRSPLATGGTMAAAAAPPVRVADAVFLRQDVVGRDTIVSTTRRDVGGVPTVGTVTTRPSRERYWSRATAVPAVRCSPGDRTCLN